MAWMESHQSLREDPKTRRLARRVGGTAAAVGHLHCLLWWCLDYAANGDLSDFDSEDIAFAAAWEGDPDEIVESLIAAGWLDRQADHLGVHDWWESPAGRTITRRLGAADRKRRSRAQDDHAADYDKDEYAQDRVDDYVDRAKDVALERPWKGSD